MTLTRRHLIGGQYAVFEHLRQFASLEARLVIKG